LARIHKHPEVNLGRSVCNRYETAAEFEWLVTNGIGGYAAGTVAGSLTRRYHGLLIGALEPPIQRTLLLSKLDETITYLGENLPLFVNHWASRVIEPAGHHHLDRFHLEGSVPVWTFGIRDAVLQKRVWMVPGENTTLIRYDNLRSSSPIHLSLETFINSRDHHETTRAGDLALDLSVVSDGFAAKVVDQDLRFFIKAPGAQLTLDPVWSSGYYLAVEDYRGLDPLDDHLRGGTFVADIKSGAAFSVIASTAERADTDSARSYAVRRAHENKLLASAQTLNGVKAGETWVQQLVLAADQFIVTRATAEDPEGRTVLAGYPWFSDWGRDTMISLPGLSLATGRPEIAARILATYARYVDQGMLPNRFPDDGEAPEYNTVDASLWYFEALRAYIDQTGDLKLLDSLYPTLQAIIAWHLDGSRHGIMVDPDDGLLQAGEPGVQLTWMDVKIGDWVVTPRTGKPVEINALWFNALTTMEAFSSQLGLNGKEYQEMAAWVKQRFDRFWMEEAGYCYDVLDGPDGDDPSLRPNQLIAASLINSPLIRARRKSVVDLCARELYVPQGLRSLAAQEAAYTGAYGGDQAQRDAAYHQGTAWAWLLGPFLEAHWRVYQDKNSLLGYFQPILANLHSHGLGTLSEIFEGDPPYTPRGCFAQAWSVAEVLRIWSLVNGEVDE
jgi:predicted glycogen debranching enzyme